MVGEQEDVILAVAQRRQADGEHVDPVVQILAEGTGLDGLFQILVRGRDDTHVGPAGSIAPDTFVFTLLQHARES